MCGSDKKPSRVPRYQNLKFFGGFCEKFFKSLARSSFARLLPKGRKNDWREPMEQREES